MGEYRPARRMVIGSVALSVVAPLAAVLATPAAAFAIGVPQRYNNVWPADTTADKTVTVNCPAGKRVLAPGGRIVDGGGDVYLTAIVPNAATDAVQVTAKLRPLAPPRAWGLVAQAVCATTSTPPVRERSSTDAGLSTTAICEDGNRVYGTGFRISSVANTAYVERVVPNVEPDVGLTSVEVGAVNRGVGALTVEAFAVCHPSTGLMFRHEDTFEFDGSFPEVATLTQGGPTSQFFGVGFDIDAPDVMIEQMSPEPTANQVTVSFNRIPGLVLPGPVPLGPATNGPATNDAALSKSTTVAATDDGSAVVYGVNIGTFCADPT